MTPPARLRRIHQERRLALVFISHDRGIIRHLSHRAHVMSAAEFVGSADGEATQA